MESKLSGRKISTEKGGRRGEKVERYVTHKILWWKRGAAPPGASAKFPSSPLENAFFIFPSFPFFFFLIFPRSIDFLTRDRCKSWKSFPPSHDARGIFKSNLARYVYSQGRESDEFLFFFFIDARTDRISRTFAYIYGFIEAVQRIF